MCWGFFFSNFKYVLLFFQSVLKAASGGSWNILPTGVLLWDGALLFCSHPVHSRHLPSTAVKTFCSLHRPSSGTNNCDICLSHMKPRRCWRPWSSEHPLREHPFRGQKKIVFASQMGKQLAWLTPGFYGDIKTEDMESFQMPISDVQIVGKTGLS